MGRSLRAYELFLYAVVAIGLVIERSCTLSSRSETYSEVRRLLQLKTNVSQQAAQEIRKGTERKEKERNPPHGKATNDISAIPVNTIFTLSPDLLAPIQRKADCQYQGRELKNVGNSNLSKRTLRHAVH